jgi:zinc D-Ala-D-Ala carboxypeptidase
MNLSKNFTLEELTKTSTGVFNGLPQHLFGNMQSLVDNVLQPARDALGPIQVTSCYRSPAVNLKIGGSKTSQHCLAQAADLRFKGGNDVLFHWLVENTEFDQIIWEFGTDEAPSWVHISYSPRHRKQKLKAIKQNGRTKYLPL